MFVFSEWFECFLHQLQLLPLAHYRKIKRCCQLPHHKNPLRISYEAHLKSAEVTAPNCSNTPQHGSTPYLLVFFFSYKTVLAFSFNFLIHSACPFIISMFCLYSFILCVCEDTIPLKFRGVVFLIAYVYVCVVCCVLCDCICLCLCCVLCELCYLIFVYGFEDLMKINWVLFSIYENAK